MNMLKVKKSITLMVGMMTITALGGIAQAETRFAVQDSTGTTDKMVVTDSGYVGVGTNTPAYPIQVKGETSILDLSLLKSTYNKYDSPTLQFARNNVSTVNTGLPQAGDRLGFFAFGTNINNVFKQAGGVYVEAEATHTSTSYPGYMIFATTSPTGIYTSERMRITSYGNVGIGTSTPGQKLEVNGGVKLNTTATRPTCNSNVRGVIWFTQGTTGVADKLEVCSKDASENYAWRALF